MKRKDKVFIIYISCAIAVFLFAAIVFGIVLKFLITIPYFDKSLHLLNAVSISGAVGIWLSDKTKMRPLTAMLFIFSFAVMIGVLCELIEFIPDTLFKTNHQHWIATGADRLGFLGATRQGSGLIDTMGDTVANIVGAAVSALIGFLWLRKKSHKSNVSD